MRRHVAFLLTAVALLAVCAGPVAAQADANNTTENVTEPADLGVGDTVVYEVGDVTVRAESWGSGHVVVESHRDQDVTLATKSSITSSSGQFRRISLDSGETVRIDLDGAAWYSLASGGEFRERTSSLSMSLLYEESRWSYVPYAAIAGVVSLAIAFVYRYWCRRRKELQGIRSVLTGHVYDEDAPKGERDA